MKFILSLGLGEVFQWGWKHGRPARFFLRKPSALFQAKEAIPSGVTGSEGLSPFPRCDINDHNEVGIPLSTCNQLFFVEKVSRWTVDQPDAGQFIYVSND